MTGNFFFCCNIWLWRLDIVASDEHARRWESDSVDLGWDGQAVLIIPLECPFFFPLRFISDIYAFCRLMSRGVDGVKRIDESS